MTLLLRGRTDYLTDRYSVRNAQALKAIDRQIQRSCFTRLGTPTTVVMP